jgi:hypothetical protein
LAREPTAAGIPNRNWALPSSCDSCFLFLQRGKLARWAMNDFKTHLLLHNLREILVSIENDRELIQRNGSFLELQSVLKLEIDRLEEEIDRDWANQPKPSVGVPF